MKKETERKMRILARGEVSNHAHILCGENIEILEKDNEKIITINEDSNCVLKHLLEKEYVETGQEIWTKEHKDIPIQKGTYKFIQQTEYNPLNAMIQKVCD